jgi:hypothetical protein
MHLETVGLARKYLGVLEAMTTCIFALVDGSCTLEENDRSSTGASATTTTTTTERCIYWAFMQGVAPMLAHRSQLTWFRYLFVAFSRYSVVNTFIAYRAQVKKQQ